MFENAMNYNIEESEIYQAAVRFRQLTLKAAKALSSGDGINGCSLTCNVESDETTKFQSTPPKRGRPRKNLGPIVKVTDSGNSIHNGFASYGKKIIHCHTEPQQHNQTNERTQSTQQHDLQTASSISSSTAQFFPFTTTSFQQHSLQNTTNHTNLASHSSQQLLTNVPSHVVSSQGQYSQGNFVSVIVLSMV